MKAMIAVEKAAGGWYKRKNKGKILMTVNVVKF